MSTNKINLIGIRGIKGIKNIALVLMSLSIITFSISSCGTAKKMVYKNDGYDNYYATSFCYRGQWSTWKKWPFSYNKMVIYLYSNGDAIGLALKDNGGNIYYRFMIDNYSPKGKEFTGTVEYYVNDNYPTAEALAKANHFVVPDYRTDKTPSVKREAKATIKIVNNEEQPAVFNIWYDNIGVAFDILEPKKISSSLTWGIIGSIVSFALIGAILSE